MTEIYTNLFAFIHSSIAEGKSVTPHLQKQANTKLNKSEIRTYGNKRNKLESISNTGQEDLELGRKH